MDCPQCHLYCPPGAEACPCGYRFPVRAEATPSPYAKPKRELKRFIIHAAPSSGTFRAGTQSKALRLGFLACLLLWILALVFDDRLPPQSAILPQLYQEPLQTAGELPAPFAVTVKEVTYVVKPLFRYEIAGLVVSQHRSDSLIDISHRRWRDYLNIKDLCLVWGRNIASGVYREMKFWNRDFTCLCRFPDEETAKRFSGRHLSNNHLLAADKALRRRILRVRPGDQVHIQGYLAEYSQPASGFARGTSTSRGDTGSGACETVCVTDFQVLRRANPAWRAVRPLAFLSGAVFLVLLLLA